MTAKYQILHDGRTIGRAFSSPDQGDVGRKHVSVMPIDRSGNFEAGTLTLSVPELRTRSFERDLSDKEAINELLAELAIEPWKVEVVPLAEDE